jgi:hypothetical protein
MLESVKLTRDEVYITNTVLCRPPGNRNPEADELAACAPFLADKLGVIQPKVILTLGSVATQAMLRTKEPIGKLRGRLTPTAPRCSCRPSIPRSCCATRARSTSAWPGRISSSPNGSTTRAARDEAGAVIADVAFDAPVERPFSYRIPPGHGVEVGQRVLAPLAGARRVGIVLAVRDGDDAGLKALLSPAEPAPLLTPSRLDLARWVAAESLSSLGSTCAALLPPPVASGSARRAAPESRPRRRRGRAAGAELLIGAGRERRLLEHVGRATSALVVVPDVEAAARWASGSPGSARWCDSTPVSPRACGPARGRR